MARVAQYKALGSALGGYKKTLSDVGAKEYAKQHESFKGEQQRAMYSAIGGTVANIIGIAGEAAKLKELKGYGESARQLRGIGERDVEYQPLGRLGEAIGLDPKTRKESFFHDTGQTLSERELQNIGYMESLGMKTKYGESLYAERPDVAPTTEDPDELGYEVLDPIYEDPTKFEGVEPPFPIKPSEMEAGLELKSMEDLPSITEGMTGATTEGQRGAQSIKIGEGTVEGQETQGYQPWLPEGVDPEYTEMIERERDEPTPFGHVVKQRQREINNPSGNPESKVFEAIKGDENKPITGYTKNELIGIASESVPRGRESEIQMVYGMESSYGQDPGAEGNILQIKNKELLAETQKMNIDLSDPQAVSKFYIQKTDEFTKGFDAYEVQTGSLSGTKINIWDKMEQQGISKSGVRYLTWQQGRRGVQDIITALDTGNIHKRTVKNMLNNVSEEQRKILTKQLGDTKKLVKSWLDIQNEKMGKY